MNQNIIMYLISSSNTTNTYTHNKRFRNKNNRMCTGLRMDLHGFLKKQENSGILYRIKIYGYRIITKFTIKLTYIYV